jgi:hypothetical protein
VEFAKAITPQRRITAQFNMREFIVGYLSMSIAMLARNLEYVTPSEKAKPHVQAEKCCIRLKCKFLALAWQYSHLN